MTTYYTEDLTPEEAQTEAARILEAAGITAHVSPAQLKPASNDDAWNQEHYAYRVSFQATDGAHGARCWFQWRTGTGIKADTVSPAQVLATVCGDAYDVRLAGSFEEWAGDFGYDTDSRKAERIYKVCLSLMPRVSRLLSHEDVERLAELARMF